MIPTIIDGVGLELIEDLKRTILKMRDEQPISFPTTNVGGWKSTEIELSKSRYPIPVLNDIFDQVVLHQLVATGWTMISESGTYHPRHQHLNVLFSGIYYIDPGDPPTSTVFESDGIDILVGAKPGRLVIFPEGVWHGVPLYTGHRPRITLVFNVRKDRNQ